MIKLFKKNEVKPNIEFTTGPELLEVFPHPVPAAKKMPEWYRKIKPTIPNQPVADAGTIKRCIPVLDAVSQGFIIPAWADIYVTVQADVRLYDENDNLIDELTHLGDENDFIGKQVEDRPGNPIIARVTRDGEKKVHIHMPFDEMPSTLFEGQQMETTISGHAWEQVGDLCDLKKFEFGKTLLKFTNPWMIKTAPGWSVKFSNPSNNFENNIHLLEGVVDTDEYTIPVNFPFVWTGSEDGEWIIQKGTPLVHVIPFRREEVKLHVGVANPEDGRKKQTLMQTTFFDRYKTLFWHKRDMYNRKDIER